MKLFDSITNGVENLSQTKLVCGVCGKKFPSGQRHKLDDGKECCELCYPCYRIPNIDYNTRSFNSYNIKSAQFNSPMQTELRLKFRVAERYDNLHIDKKSGYFALGYLIGAGNPVLPISSIYGKEYELNDDGDMANYSFFTDYGQCPDFLVSLGKSYAYKNMPNYSIWNDNNVNGINGFFEYSQKLRNQIISSGGNPSPNVF